MGWKLYSILYKPKNKTEKNLIKQIENSRKGIDYLKSGTTTFRDCMYPKEGFLYLGKYKDFLIVNEVNMSLDFFQEPASIGERFWRTLSRNGQEVYCFVLDSTTCMYGFAYLTNQRKLRCKYGTMDESVILDIGAPLSIEQAFYKKKNTAALLEDGAIEWYQIGEDLVFYFFENLLGERINLNAGLLDVDMTIYKEVGSDDF